MSKKSLSWIVKLLLSALAIYLLSQKINWRTIKEILFTATIWPLVIALILYIVSKVVSALRLNVLLRSINIELSEIEHTKLYFKGMFYNLFLPGGIGGDGYKAYFLKQTSNQSIRQIIAALFLDRFFGLCALFLLFFTGVLFTTVFEQLPNYAYALTICLLVLVLPVTYFIVKLFFRNFIQPFWTVVGYSLLMQIIQVVASFFILLAIGIHSHLLNYFVLFLASSIAAVLPISVGGIGVRELTFIYGNELLSIQKNEAVAFSLLFFLITAISSFIGAFVTVEK